MQLEILLNIEQNMSRPSPGHQQQAARTLQTALIEYTQTSKFLCDHFVTISKIIQIVLLLSCCYFWIFVTLWTVVLHALLFTEFSRQDYWESCNPVMGCNFLLQGMFPTQRLALCLLHLAGGLFTTGPPEKPQADTTN